MKNLDLSKLLGFKLTHFGLIIILFSIATSLIFVYILELVFTIDIPVYITSAFAILIYIIVSQIVKVFYIILDSIEIHLFIKNLSDQELDLAYNYCIEEQYIYLHGDINPIVNFNDRWSTLFYIPTGKMINAHAGYPIRVKSRRIQKKITNTYKKRSIDGNT